MLKRKTINNMNKKYYQNRYFIIYIKVLSIMLIAFSSIQLVLKAMLVFGYVMLFRQQRWHKHLFIMFIMLATMSIASGGFKF